MLALLASKYACKADAWFPPETFATVPITDNWFVVVAILHPFVLEADPVVSPVKVIEAAVVKVPAVVAVAALPLNYPLVILANWPCLPSPKT